MKHIKKFYDHFNYFSSDRYLKEIRNLSNRRFRQAEPGELICSERFYDPVEGFKSITLRGNQCSRDQVWLLMVLQRCYVEPVTGELDYNNITNILKKFK